MTQFRTSPKVRIPLTIGRLALAAIFLFAAYGKLHPPAGMSWSTSSLNTSLLLFAMQMDSYQLLPERVVSPSAHLLPFGELVLGVLLLSGWQLRWVGVATTALITLFFTVMIRTYALGLEVNCGCFGTAEKLGPMTILRDGSFLALALAVTIGAFWVHRRRKSEARIADAAPQHAQ